MVVLVVILVFVVVIVVMVLIVKIHAMTHTKVEHCAWKAAASLF